MEEETPVEETPAVESTPEEVGVEVTAENLIPVVSAAICEALESCCNQQDYDDYFFTLTNNMRIQEAGLDSTLPPTVAKADFDCPTALATAMGVVPFGPWMEAVNEGMVTFNAEEATACLRELESSGLPATSALFDFNALVSSPQRRRFHGGCLSAPPTGGDCMPLTDGVAEEFTGRGPGQGRCCRDRGDALRTRRRCGNLCSHIQRRRILRRFPPCNFVLQASAAWTREVPGPLLEVGRTLSGQFRERVMYSYRFAGQDPANPERQWRTLHNVG